MQYLLTQSEMENLVPLKELEASKLAVKALRELLIGDRCCAKRTTGRIEGKFSYCCECPLSDLQLDHSADPPSREMSKSMCDRSRRYSK